MTRRTSSHQPPRTWRGAPTGRAPRGFVIAAVGFGIGVVVSSQAASAQQPTAPRFDWVITSTVDTVFERPEQVAADRGLARVFVSDGLKKRVLVMDAATGHIVGSFGREGSGPGEFRAPDAIAVSGVRHRVAVYDLVAPAISLFDTDGRFLSRRSVSPMLIWPKGLAFSNDSVLVIASGIQVAGDSVPSVHWSEPQSRLLASRGPLATTTGGSAVQRTRANAAVYLAGGPLLDLGATVVMADGPTGDVWEIGRISSRRLARGPGAPHDLGQRMVILGTDRQGRFFQPWWTFPRAVLLDSLSGGGFLVAVTVQDSAVLRFYELRPGRTPAELGAVHVRVRSAAPYDRTSCLVVGQDSLGGFIIGRLRYPFR